MFPASIDKVGRRLGLGRRSRVGGIRHYVFTAEERAAISAELEREWRREETPERLARVAAWAAQLVTEGYTLAAAQARALATYGLREQPCTRHEAPDLPREYRAELLVELVSSRRRWALPPEDASIAGANGLSEIMLAKDKAAGRASARGSAMRRAT